MSKYGSVNKARNRHEEVLYEYKICMMSYGCGGDGCGDEVTWGCKHGET